MDILMLYLCMLEDAVAEARLSGEVLVHCCSAARRASQAVLAGAALVCMEGLSAEEAFSSIARACGSRSSAESWDRFPQPFTTTGQTSLSSLTCRDCLLALELARVRGWLPHYRDFDVESYRLLRAKFDASCIIPGELVAFGDPSITAMNPAFPRLLQASIFNSESTAASSKDTVTFVTEQRPDVGLEETDLIRGVSDSATTVVSIGDIKLCAQEHECVVDLKEETFVDMIQRHKIGLHVRLNNDDDTGPEDYSQLFKSAGTTVARHIFTDGSIPPHGVAAQFLQDCRCHRQSGTEWVAISICCKAGLGRTGVMLGIYAAEFHQFPGFAFHGWLRMCRPGTVQTEVQQCYLRKLGKLPRSSGAVAGLVSRLACGKACIACAMQV
jgi:hypothetical protein